ncbi:hypothetical protein BGY98DRAFT_1173743 [Russula aff. rugulosa BPL654]|nr:hypothetical protein BGY98DRAFT_1173743 [Russula aff. rugulosa BPL654]
MRKRKVRWRTVPATANTFSLALLQTKKRQRPLHENAISAWSVQELTTNDLHVKKKDMSRTKQEPELSETHTEKKRAVDLVKLNGPGAVPEPFMTGDSPVDVGSESMGARAWKHEHGKHEHGSTSMEARAWATWKHDMEALAKQRINGPATISNHRLDTRAVSAELYKFHRPKLRVRDTLRPLKWNPSCVRDSSVSSASPSPTSLVLSASVSCIMIFMCRVVLRLISIVTAVIFIITAL